MAAALALVAASGTAMAAAPAAGAAPPLWVRHVQRYEGGISNGVRASLRAAGSPAAAGGGHSAQAPAAPDTAASIPFPGGNVQMNADSTPPQPQNETSVAYDWYSPLHAVAAANDYVSAGFQIMRTADGGRTWSAQYFVPQLFPQRAPCTASDPWVDYSRRDHAFYLVMLCFFRDRPESEVHVVKSIDDGRTWTPSRYDAVAATNVNPDTLAANASVFLDNNQIVVDNNPSSPHYGRIYVTWVKFHMKPSGFSDYCPVQLSWTDEIPTVVPSDASWHHTKVVPDQPNGPGIGLSANQWPRPQVQRNGDLDIAYALEDCNSGIDRHLELQRSTDGGNSFLGHPVQVDKRGEFTDNPDKGDVLPPTAFRAPLSPSLDVNKRTGTLTLLYQNNVDRKRSKADISYQQSHDGGRTWSRMRFLSVGAGGAPARNDQFFPAVDSDEAGNVFAIWFDRRLDPANHDIDTFQSESHDDGRTWTPNHRISSASWNPDQSFYDCGCFIGDYNSIAASDQAVYPVWTDGRRNPFARTGIGETDIFTDVEIR
jgi:hypothetical protein